MVHAPSRSKYTEAQSVNHTPGSWLARTMVTAPETWAAIGDGELHVVRRGVDVIAAVWCGDDQDGEEAANARLIAAAPELLEALRGAIGALEFSRDYHKDLGNEDQAFAQDRLDAARAAIAKAVGQ